MFGISLIKTAKLQHLYSEVSKLAIENVELNKEVAKRDATIVELNEALDGVEALSSVLANEITNLDSQNQYFKRLLSRVTFVKGKKRR